MAARSKSAADATGVGADAINGAAAARYAEQISRNVDQLTKRANHLQWLATSGKPYQYGGVWRPSYTAAQRNLWLNEADSLRTAAATSGRLGESAARISKLRGLKLGGAFTAASVLAEIADGKPRGKAVTSGLAGMGASIVTGFWIGSAGGLPGAVAGAVIGAAVGAFTSGVADHVWDTGWEAVTNPVDTLWAGVSGVVSAGAGIADLGSATTSWVRSFWD